MSEPAAGKQPSAQELYTEGLRLLEEDRYEEAIAKFREVLRVEPRHREAHQGLGVAYYLLRDFKAAIPALREYISLRPNDILARNSLTDTLMQEKRYGEALEEAEELLRHSPDYALAYYNIACIQATQGRLPEALTAMERAVTLLPALKSFARGDDRLRGLQPDQAFQRLVAE